MLVQVVTFNLEGMSDAEFRTACERDWLGPVAALPGMVSKTWLANADTNTYGGVYVWQDQAAADNYPSTDFFKAFSSDPRVKNISSQVFGILKESRVTNGLGAAAAA